MANEQRLLSIEMHGAGRRGQLARDFSKVERRIQNARNRMVRESGQATEAIFEASAPRDTGQMADSIKSVMHFRGHLIRAQIAVSAQRDGFDYLNVTRFGHEVPQVVARGKRMAVHVDGRHAAPIYRRVVNPARPARDWVGDATHVSDRYIDDAWRSLGHRIDTILLTA